MFFFVAHRKNTHGAIAKKALQSVQNSCTRLHAMHLHSSFSLFRELGTWCAFLHFFYIKNLKREGSNVTFREIHTVTNKKPIRDIFVCISFIYSCYGWYKNTYLPHFWKLLQNPFFSFLLILFLTKECACRLLNSTIF